MFGIYHRLEILYQSCSYYAHVVKIDSAPESHFYIELYKENFTGFLILNRLWEFDQTGQEWSPTKIVYIVPIGCINR